MFKRSAEIKKKSLYNQWKEIYLQLVDHLNAAISVEEDNNLQSIIAINELLTGFDKEIFRFNSGRISERTIGSFLGRLLSIKIYFNLLKMPVCVNLLTPLEIRISSLEKGMEEWAEIDEIQLEGHELPTLHIDIFQCLMIFLSLSDICSVNRSCKALHDTVQEVLTNKEKSRYFWKSKALWMLNGEQYKSLNKDYEEAKEVVITRSFPFNFLEKRLQSCKGFFDCNVSLLSVFNNKHSYEIPSTGAEFTVSEIESLILTDNAQALFCKITRLEGMYPYLDDHTLDQNKIRLSLVTDSNPFNIRREDFNFILLIPALIKLRAINCFNRFILAFLLLEASSNCERNYCDFEKMLELVTSCRQTYFIKAFLFIVILNSYASTSSIMRAVRYAIEEEEYNVLFKEIYAALPDEKRKSILNEYKNTLYWESMFKIIWGDKTYKLRENLLEIDDKILENHALTSEELMTMKEKIQGLFDAVIKEKFSEERRSASNTI